MKYRHIFFLALTVGVFTAKEGMAQGAPPALPQPAPEAASAPPRIAAPPTVSRPPASSSELIDFKFEQADLDTVMTMYAEWTDKIYLKTDQVSATITLKAEKLTKDEAIEVVNAILGMNNIVLVPMGEKYIKVLLANSPDLDGQGLKLSMDPGQEYEGDEKLVTQIIHLQNVGISDVENAIRQLMHSYGKILALQSSNSLLLTDTESNIIRIRELVEFIDQATAQIEPKFYKIEHADATEIAGKLNELVTLAQSDQKTSGIGNTAARTPPGVIRARTPQPAQPAAPTQASIAKTGETKTTVIQGTVKIMADERTNLIIVFSQPSNFPFFDKIINMLDVKVEPAIHFEVINLEYADAEELSGTLNDLVGAATGGSSRSSGSSSSRSSSSRSSTSRSRTSTSRTSAGSPAPGGAPGGAQLTPNASPTSANAIENLNTLSENTKILADQRTNSILLMGEKADIVAIKNVIKSLDIMLEQVIIEAAIFEIGVQDSLSHGISWLYNNGSKDKTKIGAWDGQSVSTNSGNVANFVSSALSYYQVIPDLDSTALINLAKTEGDARVISTPIIMTTDNTEATLSIGEQRPVVTSTDSYVTGSGSSRSNYEYKDIGIQLTVTPRINPQRVVVMELEQKADQIGEIVEIDNNKVPTILNREFSASIAVPDGGTVALGGLINTDYKDTINKIPILGDIPLIGRYLFSSVSKEEIQRELVVLLTPYVMTNNDEANKQTERLYMGTDLRQEDWGRSWSESKLRDIPDPEPLYDEE